MACIHSAVLGFSSNCPAQQIIRNSIKAVIGDLNWCGPRQLQRGDLAAGLGPTNMVANNRRNRQFRAHRGHLITFIALYVIKNAIWRADGVEPGWG